MAKATNGEQKNWYKEIWFSPSKKLLTSEIAPPSDGQNPIHESLLLIKDPLVEINKNAIIYGLVEVTKYMDHWFMDKYYYI